MHHNFRFGPVLPPGGADVTSVSSLTLSLRPISRVSRKQLGLSGEVAFFSQELNSATEWTERAGERPKAYGNVGRSSFHPGW